jgi:hypothetical protein
MARYDSLLKALRSVDWNAEVAGFSSAGSEVARVYNANYLIALWSKELVSADFGNPALSFVHEMQQAGFYAAALIGLALYKPAAAAIRTVFETALYYSYFRCHPAELATLARADDYYVTKKQVIDFHRQHTANYRNNAQLFGQPQKLLTWYSTVSAVVHGQTPGAWTKLKALSGIKRDPATVAEVINTFERGVTNLHEFLILTVAGELWSRFSTPAKRELLRGSTSRQRSRLGLDTA